VLLSRYSEMGASSRLRMFQYLPYLRGDWDVHVAPFFHDGYLQALYSGRRDFLEVAAGYMRRLYATFGLRRFDLAWVEAELFPWIPWGVEKLLAAREVPLAADYDDAIFHRYDTHPSAATRCLLGGKIGALMKQAKAVLAGNEYIASYARAAGSNHVHVVPTVIDTSRYEPRSGRAPDQLTIGWIGTPKTQHYLDLVAGALEFAHRTLHARIVVIGAAGNPLPGTPVEVRPWNEGTEASDLAALDVGIMPLADSPWELGKCGYKLIQYMACGKPVIASPVGVNRQLVEHGVNGYLASSTEEWVDGFRRLHSDPHRAAEMGRAGRAKVERHYSLSALAPRVARILGEAMR
jgi:glycosyltransferase involved in cell wall biosynthesis